MKTFAIIVDFQILEDFPASVGFGFEDALGWQALRLEAAEEGLSGSVIKAVAPGAHALSGVDEPQRRAHERAAVLHPAIGIKAQAGCGTTLAQRALQSTASEAALQGFLQRPAEHSSAEEIEHDCQVKPAFAGGNIGDVAHPDPIRRQGKADLRKHIVKRGAARVRGLGPEGALAARSQSVVAHQPRDAVTPATPAAPAPAPA